MLERAWRFKSSPGHQSPTARKPIIARASDGTFLEVFEWVSDDASAKAHDHPAIAKIWEAMAVVDDMGRLEELSETKERVPHFEPLKG